MTREELEKFIAQKAGLSDEDAALALEVFVKGMVDDLKQKPIEEIETEKIETDKCDDND